MAGLLSNWLVDARTKKAAPYITGDVLDVACGPATTYQKHRDRMRSYTGIEFTKKDVASLQRKYPDAKFYQRDLDHDAFAINGKFDCVLLLAVIEHIFNQKHLFEQILKCLKPNGKIIITTPTVFGNDVVHRIGSAVGIFNKAGGTDDHIIVYNKKRFEILAGEFGLKIEKHSRFELGCNQIVVLSRK